MNNLSQELPERDLTQEFFRLRDEVLIAKSLDNISGFLLKG